MVQDEVTWLLETIKSNWPEPEFPPLIARINRDEPTILETGDRTRSVELDQWTAISAGLGDRVTEPVGTEYDHRVEATLSVRLEGLAANEWGDIQSTGHFEQVVRYAQHAIAQERSYPMVDDVDGEDIGSVGYHSLFVENETDLSHEHRDYYRRDWDVRLVGYSSLP